MNTGTWVRRGIAVLVVGSALVLAPTALPAQANLDTVILSHIHRGAAGVNGPVVVPLTAPVNGTSKGCVSIADDLAHDLVANPQNYYFNIHTTRFPAGAIRGQLARS